MIWAFVENSKWSQMAFWYDDWNFCMQVTKKVLTNFFDAILDKNSQKSEYDMLKINGLYRDHPPA